MVSRITINNVFSFGSPVTFELIANKKDRRHKEHIVKNGHIRTLKGAIIFGPNAAGKTNLIKSIALFERMFHVNSCKYSNECQFCLAPKKNGMSWEIEYSYGGHHFRYSIGTNGQYVMSEKLECLDYSESLIFDRFQSRIRKFGPLITNEPWYRQRYFTPDAFFLKKLEQDAVRFQAKNLVGKDLIVAALDGLETIHVVGTHAVISPEEFDKLLNITAYKQFLLSLMQKADLGIDGIVWEKVSPSRMKYLIGRPLMKSSLPNLGFLMMSEYFIAIVRQGGKMEAYEFRFKHGDQTMRADLESEGTIRLMHLSALLFYLTQDEATWFVDEIDHHLHPLLAYYILEQALTHVNLRAQLVVTAHDTNLMTRDLWRDDEVWFVEKRSDGSSNMYSLSQFSPKRDKNLSRGYLKGLYGALPCIGGHMV